ncbi:MAG: preprotein translocase subunit SecG [Pseudomonadota bacterium]|nr:preprotein translocase subunit SecG [Pseudomonadota bacterium]
MSTILLVVHVLLSLGIIGLVLLQRGKGADAGAALGGGASATMFGARGAANFLSRSTAILAALFIVNSLALAYLASSQEVKGSITETLLVQPAVSDVPEASVPAAPASDVPPAQ